MQSRLEGDSGISYTEFSYMLLQAFDFVAARAARTAAALQVGGNDQYGNITAGCELARKLGRPQLFGLTAPLLLDSSGQKMGKTSTGERIWLDAGAHARRTTFYQYWFNRHRRGGAAPAAHVLAAPARRARRAAARARRRPQQARSRSASSRAR